MFLFQVLLGHRLPNIVRMRLQNGENPFLGE